MCNMILNAEADYSGVFYQNYTVSFILGLGNYEEPSSLSMNHFVLSVLILIKILQYNKELSAAIAK